MVKRFLILGMLMALLEPAHTAQNTALQGFPVVLNHFYLTLDSTTFQEIQNSPFLRNEFAPTEERTTVRKDLTYTGLYFYGLNTYFEFFDAAKEKTRKPGDSAIAFGVEQAGAVQVLEKRGASQLPMQILPITRQLKDAQLPWFFMLSPKNPPDQSGISTWTMEYDRRFLAEWHAEIKDNMRGITRKEVLGRYVAVLQHVPANPFLEEVLAIELAADKLSTDLLIRQGRLFGHQVRTEGEATILQAPEFTLRLVPATVSRHGIQQITLRVNRQPLEQTQYRFGAKSLLKFNGDGTATWTF
jgi:hypothetical protein